MNPKLWELLCLKVSADIEDPSAAIARIIDLGIAGMTCRLVTQDELEEAEDSLEVYMRFVDEQLFKAGILNVYFPKPGCYEICKKNLEPLEKTK